MKTYLKAALFIFCCILTELSFAQNKIQSRQYDINDPRNPDCPCHKYQQQAENEYAQQNRLSSIGGFVNLVKENNGNPEKASKRFAGTTDVQNKSIKTNTERTYAKSKRKHKLTRINKLKFRFYKKKRGLHRVKTDYAVCFKW